MIKKIINIVNRHNKGNKTRQFIKIPNPEIEFVLANLIDDVYGRDSIYFWEHHGNNQEDYLKLAKKSEILYKKYLCGGSIETLLNDSECKDVASAYLSKNQLIEVYKHNGRYLYVRDGRHRIAAAQKLKLFIPVIVTGEYREENIP